MASGATERLSISPADRRRSARPEVQATRLRILRAAERLYAEHGFGGVSLREIAIAASQGNNNAVQYHFGSRERLIDAIFLARTLEMEAMRQEMLDDAERAGRLNDPAILLAGISMPHLSQCDERGHHPHAGFMMHYLMRRIDHRHSEGLRGAVLAAPALARLCTLLRESVNHLPDDIAATRLVLCALMFINMLISHDGAHPEKGNPEWLARHARDTIDAMTVALCRPCHAEDVKA